MFRKAKMMAVAMSLAVGGLGPVPAGAQAFSVGAGKLGAHAAPVAEVAYRGGGVRVGGYRGARVGGMRAVGVRPAYRGGAYRAAAFRPGYRPGVVRPGYRPVYPGYRPGFRPGWGPGGVAWGRPGWRPPPGAWGPGPWRPGWGWYRPGWGWGYYNNTGAWVALGVASAVAVGAAAAAANSAVVTDDAVAYCMQRFRSYNPATGTYTGYDGYQHPCP
ncbi:BA14K family protein [Xanthobacter tagetidis]|jgi:hypothetical protein|nr:BA14K family protein [Xanthobacter tagetidis]MBB6307878.1 hypothetical protein [Xanthobacter tagetidis]